MNEVLASTNNTNSTTPSMPITDDQKYKGVRGWLLLLCIYLTIIIPIYYLSLFRLIYLILTELNPVPSNQLLWIPDKLLDLNIMVFSFYPGICLWRVRTNAVKITKRFFICVIACKLTIMGVSLIHGILTNPNSSIVTFIIGTYFDIIGIVPIVFWYAYLSKSKRVRVTYKS
jgi:hypothetical protein